jgi:hypothetical protein
MTQNEQTIPPFRCPRCGGLMLKPAGSNLYWHADNNHPRCEITNIVDVSLTVKKTGGTQGDAPKENNPKKK